MSLDDDDTTQRPPENDDSDRRAEEQTSAQEDLNQQTLAQQHAIDQKTHADPPVELPPTSQPDIPHTSGTESLTVPGQDDQLPSSSDQINAVVVSPAENTTVNEQVDGESTGTTAVSGTVTHTIETSDNSAAVTSVEGTSTEVTDTPDEETTWPQQGEKLPENEEGKQHDARVKTLQDHTVRDEQDDATMPSTEENTLSPPESGHMGSGMSGASPTLPAVSILTSPSTTAPAPPGSGGTASVPATVLVQAGGGTDPTTDEQPPVETGEIRALAEQGGVTSLKDKAVTGLPPGYVAYHLPTGVIHRGTVPPDAVDGHGLSLRDASTATALIDSALELAFDVADSLGTEEIREKTREDAKEASQVVSSLRDLAQEADAALEAAKKQVRSARSELKKAVGPAHTASAQDALDQAKEERVAVKEQYDRSYVLLSAGKKSEREALERAITDEDIKRLPAMTAAMGIGDTIETYTNIKRVGKHSPPLVLNAAVQGLYGRARPHVMAEITRLTGLLTDLGSDPNKDDKRKAYTQHIKELRNEVEHNGWCAEALLLSEWTNRRAATLQESSPHLSFREASDKALTELRGSLSLALQIRVDTIEGHAVCRTACANCAFVHGELGIRDIVHEAISGSPIRWIVGDPYMVRFLPPVSRRT